MMQEREITWRGIIRRGNTWRGNTWRRRGLAGTLRCRSYGLGRLHWTEKGAVQLDEPHPKFAFKLKLGSESVKNFRKSGHQPFLLL